MERNGDFAANGNLSKQLFYRELITKEPWSHQASIYRKRLRVAANLYQRDLSGHWGCINALEFSNGGEYLASGGDDKRVLIWHVEKSISNLGAPRALRGEHSSNIFCLGFDVHNTSVYSGGNDDIILRHDFETGKTINCFAHHSPVYGLSVDKTTNNLVATATEDGKLFVYDMRSGSDDPLEISSLDTPFNAVEFHPLNGNYLVSANSRRGALLWDIRKNEQPVIQYNYINESPSCMSVRFNTSGKYILTLHRRLPPILYGTNSKAPVCTFFHTDYFNSCTMKSCTFAGPDDELVLSGSDDFNLYAWRLNDVDLESNDQWMDSADLVLYGHRSIVNQVRYNRQRCLIASSGVEKLIKLWSPFKQKDWSGDLLTKPLSPPKMRTLYSPNSMSQVSQDFNSRNTDEDPHMMAFFDSLVQRELEGWETDSSHYSMDSREALVDGGGQDGDVGSESFNDSSTSEAFNAGDSSPNESEHQSDTSWQAFPNRISYLISKKRRALLKLAIKSSTMLGNLPRRVRTKLSVSHFVTQNSNLPSSSLQSNRQHLYASPTRMQCWLDGFETESFNNTDECASTSAAAAVLSRNVAASGFCIDDSYRSRKNNNYNLSPAETSSASETTNSLSEEDNSNAQRQGTGAPFQRKRKFRREKRTNAKRSRTGDDNLLEENNLNEILLPQMGVETNDDDDDDDDEDNEEDVDDFGDVLNENDIDENDFSSAVFVTQRNGGDQFREQQVQSNVDGPSTSAASTQNGRQCLQLKTATTSKFNNNNHVETSNNNNNSNTNNNVETNNNTYYRNINNNNNNNSNSNNINNIFTTTTERFNHPKSMSELGK